MLPITTSTSDELFSRINIMLYEAGIKIRVQIFEPSKFAGNLLHVILYKFKIWLQMSSEWIEISTNGKKLHWLKSFRPTFEEKKQVNFGSLTNKFKWLMFMRPKSVFFERPHFGLYGVLSLQIFTCVRVTKALFFGVKYGTSGQTNRCIKLLLDGCSIALRFSCSQWWKQYYTD